MASQTCKNNSIEFKVDLCMTQPVQLDESLRATILNMLGSALDTFGKLGAADLPERPGRYSAGLIISPSKLSPSENGMPGLSITFGDSPVENNDQDVLQSLLQTWQWDEADTVVPSAPFRVCLRTVNSLDLELNQRVSLMQKTLYSLASLLKPAALIFPQSQCCIDPVSYLENDPASEDYFAIYGLVNTRLFTSEDEDKSVFMDTLGLHTLGLPDAQCLASDADIDFAELAYWLYNLAEYLRETPGCFEDGDSIIGLNEEEWEVSYSNALIEPERCVLNINTLQFDLDDLELAEEDETRDQ